MTKTLATLWDAFLEERSISLCPTSLTSDYRQVGKWLRRFQALLQYNKRI
jgi:hypothetical protein